MAIYHFSAKVVSRARGSSAVAAAAYRSGSCLPDERLGRDQNFSAKTGVVHSEVFLPEGAPRRWKDRATLWNEVERREVRKDAQLAREVEFAIPRELNRKEGVRLAREFVETTFVSKGMVADLNVHWDKAADGSPKPHAHVMLALREVMAGGTFGPKVRAWNASSELQGWRAAWAEHVNTRLAELGIEGRIDHRSYKEQGIALEPQNKIGPAGARREARGEGLVPGGAERAVDHRAIAARNGAAIMADPRVALDAITRHQSTFTLEQLQAFVFRHSDGKDQFDQVLGAVRAAPEMVALGRDGRGRERFTTKEMLEVEARLERSAEVMAGKGARSVAPAALERACATAEAGGLKLGEEQGSTLEHVVTGTGGLALVVGYAGSGKSAMLGVARQAWEAAGLQVRGDALSGIAAESLEAGSGIGARTIASLEHAWGQGRDLLGSREVLVVDEAGMVGSRQMERVLSAAERAGAKVVLVGDPEQLQAIEAGAAFRALVERHGAGEITQIRRQRQDWQRDATRELATGRTEAALGRYEAAGMVVGHATREGAQQAVVGGWEAVWKAEPGASQVILAHTRADVAALNQLARGRLRASGALGEDVAVQTERGERVFAPGDRLMFLRNERDLGVKNGSLGAVEAVTPERMAVRLDDGRALAFELKAYAHVDHGYASTIHKAQGVTVDRAHVLATPGLDRHAAYVALSRHRDGVALHYGQDDFAGRAELVRALGRERAKDTTLDYGRTFAERREIHVPAEMLASASGREIAPAAAAQPGRFAGLKLRSAPSPAKEGAVAPAPDRREDSRSALLAYVRVWAAQELAHGSGKIPPARLEAAASPLREINPEFLGDLNAALQAHPGLAHRAVLGAHKELDQAVTAESQDRRKIEQEVAEFVQSWKELATEIRQAGSLAQRAGLEMERLGMAEDLHASPKHAALLKPQMKALGIPAAEEIKTFFKVMPDMSR